MANELVAQIGAADLWREGIGAGWNRSLVTSLVGSFAGIRLPKQTDAQGYTTIVQIPGSLTMGTGLTFTFALVDNGEYGIDPGKVIRLGLTTKRLAAGNTLSMDGTAGAGGLAAEQTSDVTTQSTAGNLTVATFAIATANLPTSLAVGDLLGVRLRRVGSHANDTFQGSATIVYWGVKNT